MPTSQRVKELYSEGLEPMVIAARIQLGHPKSIYKILRRLNLKIKRARQAAISDIHTEIDRRKGLAPAEKLVDNVTRRWTTWGIVENRCGGRQIS